MLNICVKHEFEQSILPFLIWAKFAIIIDSCGSILVFPIKCRVFNEYFDKACRSLLAILE